MGYKILGYVVWHGGKWYMKSRLGVLGSRKALAAGAVGAGVACCRARQPARSTSAARSWRVDGNIPSVHRRVAK